MVSAIKPIRNNIIETIIGSLSGKSIIPLPTISVCLDPNDYQKPSLCFKKKATVNHRPSLTIVIGILRSVKIF